MPPTSVLAGWARGENTSWDRLGELSLPVLVGGGAHDLLIHPEQIARYLDEEKTVLAELRQQGLIREAFTRTGSHGVISILEASTLEDARTQMNRLPFVDHGIMTFDYTELTEL